MSGYFSGSANFDDLFDPYIQGGQAPACGFSTPDGRDLSARYAPLSVGQKRADVGFSGVQGYDVSNLWAARGTATYSLPFNGIRFSAHAAAKTNSSGSATASIQIVLASDGNYTITSSIVGGGLGSNTVVDQGRWLPTGASAAGYQVQFAADGLGSANFSASAGGFTSLTSSQSGSVSVSVPAASAEYRNAVANVYVRLVRAGGAVQQTVFYASVTAVGWY